MAAVQFGTSGSRPSERESRLRRGLDDRFTRDRGIDLAVGGVVSRIAGRRLDAWIERRRAFEQVPGRRHRCDVLAAVGFLEILVGDLARRLLADQAGLGER
jgi:hypothetical protein